MGGGGHVESGGERSLETRDSRAEGGSCLANLEFEEPVLVPRVRTRRRSGEQCRDQLPTKRIRRGRRSGLHRGGRAGPVPSRRGRSGSRPSSVGWVVPPRSTTAVPPTFPLTSNVYPRSPGQCHGATAGVRDWVPGGLSASGGWGRRSARGPGGRRGDRPSSVRGHLGAAPVRPRSALGGRCWLVVGRQWRGVLRGERAARSGPTPAREGSDIRWCTHFLSALPWSCSQSSAGTRGGSSH